MKITASSKLMKNHKHAVKKQINSNMKAVAMENGNAVLFSIADDGTFDITVETPGHETGWVTTFFFEQKNFNVPVRCKLFDVFVQDHSTIYVSLVVAKDGIDQLYNFYRGFNDYLWINLTNPQFGLIDWKLFDFGPNVNVDLGIANVKVNDAMIVVDIPIVGDELLHRYCYDYQTSRLIPGHPYQVQFRPNEILQTKIGARKGDPIGVQGTYTLNTIFENIFYKAISTQHNFEIYIGIYLRGVAKAIAVTPNESGPTNLFAAYSTRSKIGGIQYFKSDLQVEDEGQDHSLRFGGVVISESPILFDVIQLFADSTSYATILWGLNQRGQVFRLKCKAGDEANPSAWSVPIQIIGGVTRIAPYLKVLGGLSIIFAQTQDRGLIKLKEDSATKIWQERNVLIPGTAQDDVIEFDSFTTHIKYDAEGIAPPPHGRWLTIKTESEASFYINGKYCLLNPMQPEMVQFDELNTITIVQETHSLSAAKFRIMDGESGISMEVNPMKEITDKILNVTSWNDFAQIKVYDELDVSSNLVTINASAQAQSDFIRIIDNLKKANNRLTSQAPRQEASLRLHGV